MKSSSLPTIESIPVPKVTGKQLSIPAHYFIHEKEVFTRMKSSNPIDERDPQFILANDETVQDEFEGWSKG